jgi:hypothetical protein
MIRKILSRNLVLPALLGLWYSISYAQQGSQGNTTVFANSQITFFGNHNFVSGGSGTVPGVILTERSTSQIGYVNFSGAGITTSGANDANYVNGYVRKYGTGTFVFPVGDNGKYGPFAANADGISGAYFYANPNTAITTNLISGGNYTALPAGGPFPTSNMGTDVNTVSTVEYWDIDGAKEATISLTWDATSGIDALTGSALSKLTIVGWNTASNKWEKIPSTVDETSVLGGASTLTEGSISTSAPITANNYAAYTLGSADQDVPDLTPAIDIDDLNFLVNASRDFTVNIFEVLGYPTSGTVAFRINRPSGWDITVPGLTLTATDQSGVAGTSNVNGGSPHENQNWLFRQTSGFITVTLKEGLVIPAGGASTIGFNATRKAGTPGGTLQNITATILDGSGGESEISNNYVITGFTAN